MLILFTTDMQWIYTPPPKQFKELKIEIDRLNSFCNYLKENYKVKFKLHFVIEDDDIKNISNEIKEILINKNSEIEIYFITRYEFEAKYLNNKELTIKNKIEWNNIFFKMGYTEEVLNYLQNENYNLENENKKIKNNKWYLFGKKSRKKKIKFIIKYILKKIKLYKILHTINKNMK